MHDGESFKLRSSQAVKKRPRLSVVNEEVLRHGCASILTVCKQRMQQVVDELQAAQLPKAVAMKAQIEVSIY